MKKLSQILKEILQKDFSSHILPLGWKPVTGLKGAPMTIALFNKDINENIIHVLDFQRDKYWENENGKFCINVGVYHKGYDLQYGFKNTGIIDTAYCFIRERLGIIKSRTDDWYAIDTRTDLNSLTALIISDFNSYGILWFNKLTTNSDLIDWFNKDNNNLEMYMHLLADDIIQAKKCFREIAYQRIDRDSRLISLAIEKNLLKHESIEEFKNAMIQSNEDLKENLDNLFKNEDRDAADGNS